MKDKQSVSPHLLSPFNLHGLALRNRVVMAPLTRARAGHERVPNDLMAEYYAQRASAGLIITEATVISKQGFGWVDSPGIYNDAQVAGWKKTTAALHAKGTPVFLQLWHCGRASHSSFHGGKPAVSASAIKLNGDYIHTPVGKQPHETPRALETAEVAAVVQDYRRAAERAKAAGFDGVEIHAANGYLIDQFLQSRTNQRKDRYGGSLENRMRFGMEVIDVLIRQINAVRDLAILDGKVAAVAEIVSLAPEQSLTAGEEQHSPFYMVITGKVSLQVQTNGPGMGLGTDWVSWPGSETTNQVMVPLDPAAGSVFLRLVLP